jgi:ABC-2 type transport system permease protein
MTGGGVATVARQEFRLRLRAGRWKLLLGIWFGLLVAFTALVRVGAGRATALEDEGVVVYGALTLFVLGLALLVVPSLAAQSVNGDRERGTLATLQVTRLTPADIVLGKFAAAWGTALVFLALTLPLVAYAVTQGGVPVGRVLVVTLVLALLLGTVCAVALWLSSVLSRTTTSGVLAYLAVAALTIGTLIAFGIGAAVTSEPYTESYQTYCPNPSDLPPDLPADVRAQELDCTVTTETFEATRTRTDKVWWLLAPNPFVVLADAAPALPPVPQGLSAREEEQAQEARDLDVLGQLGTSVRDLRRPPSQDEFFTASSSAGPDEGQDGVGLAVAPDAVVQDRLPVWPYGLAFDVLLALGALALSVRRLRTPTRTLPRGQRVA